MKKGIIIAVLLFWAVNFYAQKDYYFIGFTDKIGGDYSLDNPQDFLSQRAIERRQKWNIEIDSTDLPVSKKYLNTLRQKGADIIHPLRWSNGVIARVNPMSISELEELPFVSKIEVTHYGEIVPFAINESQKSANSPRTPHQNEMIGVSSLHSNGFTGSGVHIAVIDAGFQNINNNPYFNHLYQRDGVKMELNLYGENSIYNMADHGANVLSTMCARGESFVGTAPDAQYYLICSEDIDIESFAESDFLCRAVEIADSAGVDLINISLGYHHFDNAVFNFKYEFMTGSYYRSSYTVKCATERGVICCVAAGNSGSTTDWPHIDSPGDVDQAITVGAVDDFGAIAPFSSIGPNANGTIKPTLCAQGRSTSYISPQGQITTGNGTSYASPLVCGGIASLMSALKNKSPFEIVALVKKSCSLYNNPNNTIGYGIPNFWNCYLEGSRTDKIDVFEHNHSVYVSGDDLFLLGTETGENYIIFDACARAILRGKIDDSRINISSLRSGFYIININGINTKFIKK